MEVPLEHHIRQILSQEGISFMDGNHPTFGVLYGCTAKFREHLLQSERGQSRTPFSQNSFWKITPKYRFDILRIDIPRVANAIATAIGLASIYFEHIAIADVKASFIPTMGDFLFWNNVDYGIRLSSSGWDRIALMLDLAYELNTDTNCNLKVVLKELSKDPQITNQAEFKSLKKFRDTDFNNLEAKVGEGARHEATHLVSPQTRHLFEFLDAHVGNLGSIPPDIRPKERLEFLKKHYELYISGIEDASKLIAFRWK